jgi:hypothetical protein
MSFLDFLNNYVLSFFSNNKFTKRILCMDNFVHAFFSRTPTVLFIVAVKWKYRYELLYDVLRCSDLNKIILNCIDLL